MIISKYESDVGNIWNYVRPEDVHVIYDRFLEFSGIGDALARMAQFILVREYGIAGGAKNIASRVGLNVPTVLSIRCVNGIWPLHASRRA